MALYPTAERPPAAMRELLAALLLALLPGGPSAPAQPLGAATWRARVRGRLPPSPAEGAGAPHPPREPCGQPAAGVRRCARGALRGPGAADGGRRRGPVCGRWEPRPRGVRDER